MERLDRTANFQRGLGDGLSLAIEFVVAPLVFALIGFGLDRWFGTGPLCAVVLGGLAFVGVLLRTYYAYMARMQYEEEGKPWTRSPR